MTFALSEPLQAAVFARLAGDAALAALVGDAIHDQPPQARADAPPATHVTLGEERTREAGSAGSAAAVHEFSVTVHTTEAGFRAAKEVAAAVCAALEDAPLALSRGHLVSLRFVSARAERNTARRPRRVVLRFRAYLEDTA